MSDRTLLLTREFAPNRILPWDRAMTMLFQGKVEVVEEYPEAVVGTIPAGHVRDFKAVARAYGHRFSAGEDIVLRVPSVLRLYRGLAHSKRGVKFSRLNVFTRDGFRCSYCGSPKQMGELNYDHVIPRHQGGRTVWENIVSSCYPCNLQKRNRTPEQAGMKLLRQPHKPRTLPMVGPRFSPNEVVPAWLPYMASLSLMELGSETAA